MYARPLPWRGPGAYMHHMKLITTLRPLALAFVFAGCAGSDTAPGQTPMAVDGAAAGMAPAAGTSSAAGSTGSGRVGMVARGAAGAAGKPAAISGGSSAAGATSAGSGGMGGTPAMSAAGSAGDASSAGAGGATPPASEPVWNDPGTMPWQVVPEDKVAAECKLDPAMLAANDSKFGSGWAVVRYGKLCHEAGPRDSPTEAYSATKTLGALVTGIASYETRMFQKSGPRTGQLSDTDLASHWLQSQSYNKEALVAHVLGMVGHNA